VLFLSFAAISPAQIVKTINEYPVPTPGSGPNGIAPGPDGALWFTESYGNKVGRITTLGHITEYPLPTSQSYPFGITAGPDGALWFTESDANRIGRITASGFVTEYPVPTTYSYPLGITAGPGGALWFTEFGKIGRITTSGVITEYPLPTGDSYPTGITAGPDGALWFAEFYGNRIGRITTSGVITEYAVLTSDSYPMQITAGPDGALWFNEIYRNLIGRITASGVIIEYPTPTSDSHPARITVGPDGALWFAERGTNQIGRITTSGVITEYPTPTSDSYPYGITVGPDGALWFTELAGKIGQVVLAVSPRQGFALPTPMGVSVGNTPSLPYLYAGTAGLLVHSLGKPSSKFILSNDHVLGAIGPTLCPNTAAPNKTWTLQPGTLDIGRDPGNNPSYYLGTVMTLWPLKKGASNSIDAAISQTNATFTKTEILGIGQPNPVVVSPTVAEGVVKSGRTTGVTVGTVEAINVTVTVNYGAACGTYTFVGQTSVFGISPGAFSNVAGYQGNPFSRAGDSGSAILDSTTKRPMGLLFAGGPWLTFANPISEVYTRLNVFPESRSGAGPSSVEELRAMEGSLQNALIRRSCAWRKFKQEMRATYSVCRVSKASA